MALIKFVLLSSVLFFLPVQGKDYELTPFGMKVKSILPQKTYDKIFATNFENLAELLKATDVATKRFEKVIGSSIDKSISKQFDSETRRLQHIISPSLLFAQYTSSIPRSLKQAGILNSGNLDFLAQGYANFLIRAARKQNDGKLLSTFPVLTAANARFFRSLGLYSKKFVNQFGRNINRALKKF